MCCKLLIAHDKVDIHRTLSPDHNTDHFPQYFPPGDTCSLAPPDHVTQSLLHLISSKPAGTEQSHQTALVLSCR